MGEKITGGTLYQMDDGADTGAILLQDWCHIRLDDTAQTLWQRELAPLGLRLFQQYLRDWQIKNSKSDVVIVFAVFVFAKLFHIVKEF